MRDARRQNLDATVQGTKAPVRGWTYAGRVRAQRVGRLKVCADIRLEEGWSVGQSWPAVDALWQCMIS